MEPAIERGHIDAVWPLTSPRALLLRELAALLLEDPDNRLRAGHARALLQVRLSLDAPPAAALDAAVAEAAPIVRAERGARGSWDAGVLRLDAAALRAAIAAAAAAAVDAAGGGEEARLSAAIQAAWPDAEGDDGDYLATAIAGALLRNEDSKGQLPRATLHLTDVGSALRAQAAHDPRLAAVFPRNREQPGGGGGGGGSGGGGAGGGGRRSSSGSSGGGREAKGKPRLSEFVATERCAPYFRIIDSAVRKGEKALALLTDALLANLDAQRARVQQQQPAPAPAAAPPQQPPPPLSPAVAAAPSPAGAVPLWAPLGIGGGQGGVWGCAHPGGNGSLFSATQQQQALGCLYGPGSGGLFSADGDDGDAPAVEREPSVFAGPRWGSGLPALQPLVGSFSSGTGLGLGTLLRGFGTEGGGGSGALGSASDAGGRGSFSGAPSSGGLGDAPLFGGPPPHAGFGAPGAPIGVGSLPLGPSPLDLVPRAIASVWGAPGPDPSAAPGGPIGSAASRLGERDGGAAAPPPPPPPQREPGALSSSSSGGRLSLKNAGAGAAIDSSIPDTEDTVSPLSGADSEGHPGASAAAPPSAAAIAAACLDEGDAGGAPDAGGGAAAEGAGTGAASAGDAASAGGDDESDAVAAGGAPPAADAADEAGDDTQPKRLTGWALIAAKTPARPQRAGPAAPSAPRSAPAPKEQSAAAAQTPPAAGSGGGGAGAGAARRSDSARAPLARLHPSVREEVERLIARLGGVVRAMLHKCGPRVYKRVEEAVASSHLEWHHFDAGVVKVLAELARLSEDDVFEELEALRRSDLKSLQHVPAYLNKRLNNRLWQRRKARGGD
ncbi:hypothetical protein Rsub_06038 [Raphidocelis subcapitata]|uniref:Uncharacterized protein n=1 Tax=Raphidocelis subcapitata TaxID=307507 RepID=A0A2V0P0A9_9CHLO|nr:hypothetical protein Rsub_06038 [Raphidocelis subcapitata]|eukprot:GBF93306.1 hypothetical protein Rsub_06038 [Raphidocelis subcapitata]